LRGGPADGTQITVTAPAPEMVSVPVRLADGLGESRYYRTEDSSASGMLIYEHPGTVH
jgi:hypothetical protein